MQALQRAVLSRPGGGGIVMAESLDRLSRDQADIASIYRELTFAGVRIV